jgi:beta-mannosidase
LERARTRWPECTGALYYKMNDNFPAASWACADWFGVAKISQYICMDAYAPLHACAVFESLNTQGKALSLPIFLLDDADQLKDTAWEVVVRAYGPDLKEIKRRQFVGQGSIKAVSKLGEFTLTAEQNQAAPLLTVVEVKTGGTLADRTFYWSNYEARQGCLMQLPKTSLSMHVKSGNQGSQLIVKNEGAVPAVGVNFVCPEVSDQFVADDGYFWLDAGETQAVNVNLTQQVGVAAWNADGAR